MRRLLPILLWSAISAAFIGPGTVTTAAAAGAGHGLSLLWALLFSTLACLSLQEAAARLTSVSGLSLTEAMQQRFGRAVPIGVVVAVVLGCAAYEAGNILGAVAGASLQIPLPNWLLTGLTAALALLLLWSGSPQRVAQLIGAAVAVMGVAFIAAALRVGPDLGELLQGSLVPGLPSGSATLVLGLVGTTVVPYNLFLGSGLAQGQTLKDIRLGLGVAVPLGGLISAAVLVTGTAVDGPFSYQALATALGTSLGTWAALLFGLGLFAAGLSSAVTAPLAAALAARSLVPSLRREKWQDKSWRFRAAWLGVLVVGLCFGLSGIKPIPVIILAQALNGLILPLVAIFLFIASNDPKLMGEQHRNGPLANAAIGLSCAVALLLGCSGLVRAASSALGFSAPSQGLVLGVAAVAAVVLAAPVLWVILRQRD